MPTLSRSRPVTVWDLPTRAVHWLLVGLVPFSWWSATTGRLPWHRLSGYAILALLLFRLAWGVVGSETARFASFVKGPAHILDQLRGRAVPASGHAPLGALSVVAMFALLVVQVALGLFSSDEDDLEPGPLNRFVSLTTGHRLAKLHHITFYILLCLIALHLAAIVFYELRSKRLVGAMVTGRRTLSAETSAPSMATTWLAALLAIAAAAISWIIAHGLRLTGSV